MTHAITDCPACEGTGNLIVQERPRSWYDDGLEFSPCRACAGSGEVVDYDAMVFGEDTLPPGESPTWPAPPPDGCAL